MLNVEEITLFIDVQNLKITTRNIMIKIIFNQESWSKPYTDINTELTRNLINDFKKGFFKFMNKAIFRKTITNVRKHRDIKLTITEAKRNYLVSEPNYDTTKRFSDSLLAIQTKRT